MHRAKEGRNHQKDIQKQIKVYPTAASNSQKDLSHLTATRFARPFSTFIYIPLGN